MTDSEAPGFDALKSAELQASKRYGRRIVAHPAKRWTAKIPQRGEIVQHATFLGGLGAVTIGFYMIYHPLGPIVGGVIAVTLGMLLSSETDSTEIPKGRR